MSESSDLKLGISVLNVKVTPLLARDLALKGEFTNFDNVILNDAPRYHSNIQDGLLRIWSPLTGVIVFLRGPESNHCLRGRFWVQFSL